MLKKSKRFLLFVLLIPCWGIALRPGIDYSVYYKVSEWVNQGRLSHLYQDSIQIGSFYYGPLALVFFKPLSWFSFNAGHWVFFALQTLAYLVFWTFLFRLFPEKEGQKKPWLWLLVWLAAIKPIHSSFQCYNIQLFFAASFVLAEWLTQQKEKSKQISGGILLSAIAAIKFFPGFIGLLYWITKSKNVKLGTVIGAILAFLIPVVVFGWQATLQLHLDLKDGLHLYHATYPLKDQIFFLSLPSLLATWLSPWLETGTIEKLTYLTSGLIALAFYYFAWKGRKNPEWQSQFFALGLAVMTVINTSTRVDYYVFFLPAFFVLVQLWQEKPVSFLFKSGACLAFALMYLISEWTLQSSELNHRLEAIRIPVIGMIVLLILLTRFLKEVPTNKELAHS